MNTKQGGLYLVLADDNSPAWDVECRGTFIEPDPMKAFPELYLGGSAGFWTGCNTKLSKPSLMPCVCRGTGRVSRRLVGEVDIFAFTPWAKSHTFYYNITHKGYPETITALIAAHRAGTLPSALYADPGDPADWRLREVGA